MEELKDVQVRTCERGVGLVCFLRFLMMDGVSRNGCKIRAMPTLLGAFSSRFQGMGPLKWGMLLGTERKGWASALFGRLIGSALIYTSCHLGNARYV